ncbi:MAG: hypothetical protein NTW73_02525 [Candidatus Parcubacteria bacterium]|nr:hypothetical protein [Candidatus Parcubacteria bacterium]
MFGEIPFEVLWWNKEDNVKAAKVCKARDAYYNPWWESNNPKVLAWAQTQEPVLVMPREKYLYALFTVLKREVSIQEVEQNSPGLMRELMKMVTINQAVDIENLCRLK